MMVEEMTTMMMINNNYNDTNEQFKVTCAAILCDMSSEEMSPAEG